MHINKYLDSLSKVKDNRWKGQEMKDPFMSSQPFYFDNQWEDNWFCQKNDVTKIEEYN